MKISIAATNPCHLYPLALELARADALGCYYSGYPAWKLAAPPGLAVRTHSLRTTMVYGALKFLPARLRPSPRSLFLWQDHGFDAWVGRRLEPCDALHAMPGQALRGLPAALRKRRPVPGRIYRQWLRLIRHPIESPEQWEAAFGRER